MAAALAIMVHNFHTVVKTFHLPTSNLLSWIMPFFKSAMLDAFLDHLIPLHSQISVVQVSGLCQSTMVGGAQSITYQLLNNKYEHTIGHAISRQLAEQLSVTKYGHAHCPLCTATCYAMSGILHTCCATCCANLFSLAPSLKHVCLLTFIYQR